MPIAISRHESKIQDGIGQLTSEDQWSFFCSDIALMFIWPTLPKDSGIIDADIDHSAR